MRVTKVFNNNVVLALDERGQEVVLMGRGIGFQRKPDDDIDRAAVERVFLASETENPERLAALVNAIPLELIALSEDIVTLARAELGPQITQHLLIPLADHINFSLRRAKEATPIAYPLSAEVSLLYPREVAFARKALHMVSERTGVELPELEAVPFSLHFVNAQFGAEGDLGRTMEMTELFADVVALVQEQGSIQLDDDSLDVARFITHLRYLFVRQQQGRRLTDGQGALLATLQVTHPLQYACAEQIQELLHDRFDWESGPDELVYLTLHVARLTAAAEESRP